ncbi:hypothetical protein A2U01_0012139 [Trifolium medium]|uniref:Uncharacterized protein n=1 Tax=Trifolium medium TaxID=97028 RepID=A0A392MV90_9FABA|nr:hypothetical protein [Trifolium medium]
MGNGEAVRRSEKRTYLELGWVAARKSETTLSAVRPTVKSPTPSPISGETPVKSTQACFPPTHPYTRTSVGRSVNLPSYGSVKFTGASFFTEIPARLKISKSTSLTRSCLYFSLEAPYNKLHAPQKYLGTPCDKQGKHHP